MLKTSKDTFWKVMLLIFCKVLKGYKWTFPMVTAWKHTYVTNIFTTQEFKTFFWWSEAFSKLDSCPREICKVLSSPSPLQGYCMWYFSFYIPFMKSSISLWWRRAQGHCTCNGIFLYWSGNFILFCSQRLIPIRNGHPVGTTFLIQCHTQKSSGLGKIYSTCTNILGYCGK